MTEVAKQWERYEDADGNVGIVDPPVIREYEQRIEDAKSAADNELIAYLTAEYERARTELVEGLEGVDTPADPAVVDTEGADVTTEPGDDVGTGDAIRNR